MADEYVEHARAHMLARYSVNGVNASDFMDVTHSIEKWDDWCKAWAALRLPRISMSAQPNTFVGRR
jgi:hypothetical protein